MVRIEVIALLATTAGAWAQIYDPLSYPQSNNYDFTTYVDVTLPCTDSATATDSIVTATVTATTCPACTTHRTTYTTVWQSVCETAPGGMADVTYTITESCTGATPTWNSHPTYIPPGYTATRTWCGACGDGGSTVTVTVPCGLCTGSLGGATGGDSGSQPSGGWGSQPGGGYGGQSGSGMTTTVTQKCNGGTMCPQTSTTTGTITRSNTVIVSRSSIPPYTGNHAPTPAAAALGAVMGGAFAAIGLIAL